MSEVEQLTKKIEARRKWAKDNKLKQGLSLSFLQHESFTDGLEYALYLMQHGEFYDSPTESP